MSESKFTPGPWSLFTLEDSDSVRIFYGTHYLGSIGNSDDEPSQARANALLIAAAPDMHAALEQALAFLDNSEHSTAVERDAYIRAEMALAKADGKGR
jgi:hypothetical protein